MNHKDLSTEGKLLATDQKFLKVVAAASPQIKQLLELTMRDLVEDGNVQDVGHQVFAIKAALIKLEVFKSHGQNLAEKIANEKKRNPNVI